MTWFRMQAGLVVLVTTILGASLSGAQPSAVIKPDVASAQANAHLTSYIDEIMRHIKALDALYEEPQLSNTLLRAIRRLRDPNAPVDRGRPERHLIRWNWERARDVFYSRHVTSLRDSISMITGQGFAPAEGLTYLDHGMTAWRKYEDTVEQALAQHVDLVAKDPDQYANDSEKHRAELEALTNRQFFIGLTPTPWTTIRSAPSGQQP